MHQFRAKDRGAAMRFCCSLRTNIRQTAPVLASAHIDCQAVRSCVPAVSRSRKATLLLLKDYQSDLGHTSGVPASNINADAMHQCPSGQVASVTVEMKAISDQSDIGREYLSEEYAPPNSCGENSRIN
jgi:hypothetical protein